MAPRRTQISAAGTQPTPAAMPADSVRMPAPATLLMMLNDVETMPAPVDGAFMA